MKITFLRLDRHTFLKIKLEKFIITNYEFANLSLKKYNLDVSEKKLTHNTLN